MKGDNTVINFLLICTLGYSVYKINDKIEKNNKIIGNLKISDLDEDFWDE